MAAWFSELKDVGRWIWLSGEVRGVAGRVEAGLFHGEVTPPPGTCVVEMHVSAEGRYTIWLNDDAEPLGHGPARTDRYHRSLDVYEVGLSKGVAEKPVRLWAQVRWFAGMPEAPYAEMMGPMPALLVLVLFRDAAGRVIGKSGSGDWWLAAACGAFSGKPNGVDGAFFIGDTEHQRSSGFAEGWRKAEAPRDAAWHKAQVMMEPYFWQDPEVPWSHVMWLMPREIAPTEYQALPIREIRRMKAGGHETIESLGIIRLGAGETATFRCDLGELALAYYRVRLRGKGTVLEIKSSEVLVEAAPGKGGLRRKSFDLDSNLPLVPLTDSFAVDTEGAFTFESSHWRAFRFLELTLTAGAEGGGLESFTLQETGYPFEPDYAFDASSETDEAVAEIVQKTVDISWRTLKCCTWETYMDSPYYEQLQYIGDTRLQCLITYMTTGDPALPAQALRAFDRSRVPEGLTQCRYPCTNMGIIPTFSLIYILMIEDYLLHIGDEALVAELRPGITPILNWFSRYMDSESGLIGYVPYWPFIDWVKGWGKGVSPHGGKAPGLEGAGEAKYSGASAAVNLFFLMALQSASNLYERSKAGAGNFYAGRAAALKQRLYDAFFDKGRGLVCDVPVEAGRGKFGVWSQHSQALAVLAGLLSPSEARGAMSAALDAKNVLRPNEATDDVAGAKAGRFENRFMAPASFYFMYYVAEALAKLRMGAEIWPLMAPFREAIGRGSTTWPEAFEPARSECHAWSAWPLYFFGRHVLGISPPSLEDGRVRVRPLFCPPLVEARGHFQTHRGPVTVEVSWKDGKRRVAATGNGVEVVGE